MRYNEVMERNTQRGGLACEARRLMAHPAYVREAREVAALMEALRVQGDVHETCYGAAARGENQEGRG